MTKKITVKEEGVTISDGVRVLNFTGAGVTASGTGSFATIAITGGGGGTLTTQDEGATQSTTVTTLNVTGAGATISGAGATATLNIPGGGAPSLPPTNIYVAPTGSDANNGLTPLTPFLTLTKAINTVGEAAPANYAPVIHIGNGTYPASQMQGAVWPGLTRESSGIIFWGDGAGQGADDGTTTLFTGTINGALSNAPPTNGLNLLISNEALTPSAFVGRTLEITSGANLGFRRTIIANDATTITTAIGFTNAQTGGSYKVFEPAVIIDDNVVNANARRRFQMMPLAYSYGLGVFFIQEDGGRDAQFTSPACVWANVKLAKSAGVTYCPFMFGGGQVCLFGVMGVTSDLCLFDVTSLFIGTTKSLLPGNASNVFEPPSALAPLAAAVPGIRNKWNGWGFSDVGGNYVGAQKAYVFGYYSSTYIAFQDIRFGELTGLDAASNTVYFNRCRSVTVLASQGLNWDLKDSDVDFLSNVYVANQLSLTRSVSRCEAQITSAAPQAVFLADNSHLHFSSGGFTGSGSITFASTACLAIDNSAPATPILSIGNVQLPAYFTDTMMGILSSDGSTAKGF